MRSATGVSFLIYCVYLVMRRYGSSCNDLLIHDHDDQRLHSWEKPFESKQYSFTSEYTQWLEVFQM